MMEYHSKLNDDLMKKLREEYLNLARVCFLFGIMLGVVLGAVTHHWWYHQ